jgi:dipicolinate synthase subunit A
MAALPPEQILSAAPYMDAVLNTIPAVVLDRERLQLFRKQTIFLELASPPYGIDLPAAAQLGLNVQVLPGLPTQYAPLSVARALAETIVNRFKEGRS